MGNIIIAGGGLVNKGAQAMTLICVCELKKRFPGHRLQLLVWDDSPDAQKCHAPYDLELLQIPPLKFAGAAGNPLKRALYALRYGRSFTDTDHIYRNTDFLVDISGYALGSNWSEKVCNDYLDNIEHALAYGIPVFLLPYRGRSSRPAVWQPKWHRYISVLWRSYPDPPADRPAE